MAAEAVRALGFATSPFSSCEWQLAGTQHSADAVCCVFSNEYLDLIDVSSEQWEAHLESSAVYSRGLAPTGVVFSGPDLGVASEYLDAEPYSITRNLQVDPPRTIHYEFLSLASLRLPFGLIRDTSPNTLRDASTRVHPNTALGISAIHLGVASVSESLAQIARQPLLLPPATPATVGTTRLWLHEAPRDTYLARVLDLLPRTSRPALLALEFSVGSLEAAADTLQARGVEFTLSTDAVSVEPEQGFGTGIVFSPSTT